MTPSKAAGERWYDVHAHHFASEYLEALEHAGLRDVRGPRGTAGAAERVELMDRAGVDVQVLSPARLLPTLDREQDARRVARIGNDALARYAAQQPARLQAFAALPLPHLDAALAELDYALDELGMAGVTVGTSVQGRSLADDAFAPLLDALDRRGALLFVHPVGDAAGMAAVAAHRLTWRLGAPFEDAVAAAQLITGGVLERHQRMRVVICHAGGALPVLVARMDALRNHEGTGDAGTEPASAAVRRLWFDTCVHGDLAALRCARDVFGADRLLLGTDYPYQAGDHYVEAVGFLDDLGATADEVRAIRSASALLPHLSPRGGNAHAAATHAG